MACKNKTEMVRFIKNGNFNTNYKIEEIQNIRKSTTYNPRIQEECKKAINELTKKGGK